jgi:hypothetical protein
MTNPDIDSVRSLCQELTNWGRWGPGDQAGTLNFITSQMICDAARLVRRGKVFSLAIPLDESGPWNASNRSGRFNPIHLMIRDGNDALAGTTVRDFYGGKDGHIRGTDGKTYNGYDASFISKGALRNDIAAISDRVVSRGVLLDIAGGKQRDWLEPGYAIGADDLEACARAPRA